MGWNRDPRSKPTQLDTPSFVKGVTNICWEEKAYSVTGAGSPEGGTAGAESTSVSLTLHKSHFQGDQDP